MAITNAQQFKQLVNPPMDGKRPGYRGPGGYQGGRSDTPAGAAKAGSVERGGGNTNRERGITQQFKGPSGTTGRIDTRDADPRGPDRRAVSQFSQYGKNLMNRNLKSLTPTIKDRIDDARNRSIKKFIDRSIRKDLYRSGFVPNSFMGLSIPNTASILGEAGYSMFGPDVDLYDEDSTREIAAQLSKSRPGISKMQSKALESFAENIANRDELLDKGMTQSRFEELYPTRIPPDNDGPEPLLPIIPKKITREDDDADADEKENVGKMFRLMADGGMTEDAPVGGIMDIETGRQMYGLGKLVKKATRAVKKIVKSPVGKAALLYAGTFGIPFTGFKGLAGTSFGTGLMESFSALTPMKKAALIGGGILTAAPFFMKQEEDDEEDIDRGPGLEIDRIRANPYLFTPRRFAAEGGSMKEPVAKKTMPLIDMDGKEKDYRETGGFVDMGRMERADDVPARLSKNEFVFTADAVRNAGDGSVDKGAEVMYNMMKNLEAGGDVSEESQGLDGAREMFQTSQRLGEVL
jgi:hypothetical protein